PSERLVEFDAIEDDRPVIDKSDIAEVKVAVTLTDKAMSAAFRHCCPHGSMLIAGPVEQRVEVADVRRIVEQWPELPENLQCARQDCIGIAERAIGRRPSGRAMEGGHLRGERVDVGGGK